MERRKKRKGQREGGRNRDFISVSCLRLGDTTLRVRRAV